MTTWRALLGQVTRRCRAAGLECPGVDARRIVEEVSGRAGAGFVVGLDDVASADDCDRVEALVARRLAGEPLQYVLGRWGFRTVDLVVDRRVLIPRPETEQVTELALVELDELLGGESTSNRRQRSNVVDLGCGSGAIGLAIAAERGEVDVWSVDRSADALAVARINRGLVGGPGAAVTVLHGSWFEPLPSELFGAVDLIVANPPYVAATERLPDVVARWEPTEALVAGPTGLEAITQIVEQAPGWLAPHGRLVIEIGDTQGPAASRLARAAGFTHVDIRPDLAGRDRALVARRSSLPPDPIGGVRSSC